MLGFKEIFVRLPNGLLRKRTILLFFGVLGGSSPLKSGLTETPSHWKRLENSPGLYCWVIFLLFLYPFFGKVGGGLEVDKGWRGFIKPLSTCWDFKFWLGSLNRRY
ncbi:MAG: hypothetical protein ABGW77_01915 [Campylobacterales bacterium]